MTIDEQTRFDLRAYFRDAMGEDRLADALMEALPPLDYGELATKQDLLLTKSELRADMADLRADMGELRADMGELRTELKGEMGELRTELKGEMGELRTELKSDIAAVRSEMSLVERSVNGQIRTGMALTIGSTLSTWGVMVTLFGVL